MKILAVGDLHITDTSTNGLNPDPNGDLIPSEHVLTIVQVGFIPPLVPTVVNAKYYAGDPTNPANIKGLVIATPSGTIPMWCDPSGNNCIVTPPITPNTPGVYIWCVKALDTATGLNSEPCVMDTVTILDIAKLLETTKTAGPVTINIDGSYAVDFTIKVANVTNFKADTVLLKDDLSKVFNATNNFKVVSVTATGSLVRNPFYDGLNNIELLNPSSVLTANKVDSVVLKINISSNTEGNYENTAIGSGKTFNKLYTSTSTDPTRKVSINDTTRKPTLFAIPKIGLNIPEGFSPNNDGVDDTWFIKRPFGAKVAVKIFNRWGNELYKSDDYQNDWRGKSVSNFLGEDLPEGTYYYIVELLDTAGNRNKFSGPLTIVR